YLHADAGNVAGLADPLVGPAGGRCRAERDPPRQARFHGHLCPRLPLPRHGMETPARVPRSSAKIAHGDYGFLFPPVHLDSVQAAAVAEIRCTEIRRLKRSA